MKNGSASQAESRDELLRVARRYFEHQLELGFDHIYSACQMSNSPSPSQDLIASLYNQIKDCNKCPLHKTRSKFVFGEGSSEAQIFFIGEAPGRDEDLQGRPFVGAAGRLLTKMLKAIDLSRSEVFIGNILKCRPPNNRDPLPDEVRNCEPHLQAQLSIIQPALICALGRIAAQTLLGTTAPLGKLRGSIHDYQGIGLIATYHPAALLRNPNWKRGAWEDLLLLRREHDRLSKNR
jgi:DNA polymerase